MSLHQSRAVEERLRKEIEEVRGQLTSVVAAVQAGDSAAQDLAAMQDRADAKTTEGVYRDAAAERAGELRARVEAGRHARGQRERLRREEARLLAALEQARLDIERAGVRRTALPVLEHLPEASSCAVRWDEMTGEGDARTCPHCKASLFNVAMLEPAQAEMLLGSHAAATSDLRRRADGTLVVGDCGHAASRQRFLQIASTVVGLMIGLVAAVVIVYSRVEPRDAHGTLKNWSAKPPKLESNEPPRPAPVLRNATGVHIEDGFETLGSDHKVMAKIDRDGSKLAVDLECAHGAARVARKTEAPGDTLDRFLAVVGTHRVLPGGAEDSCSHSDDYPELLVTISMPSGEQHMLRVKDCSYQWFFDGDPLAPTDRTPKSTEDDDEKSHPDINHAYSALTTAIGIPQCLEELAKKDPYPPRGRIR